MTPRVCKYCETPLARGSVQAHEKACDQRPLKRAKAPKGPEMLQCPVCREAFVKGVAFIDHVREAHPLKEG